MEKIKEYKGIIILILIVLAGAFYWYEWRPYSIKKDCIKTSNEMAFATTRTGTSLQDVFTDTYNFCLTTQGVD